MLSKGKQIINYARYSEAIVLKKGYFKTLDQREFEKAHPEIYDLYSYLKEFQRPDNNPNSKKNKKKKNKKTDFISKFEYLYNC